MGGEVGGLQVDTSDTQLCVDSCRLGGFRGRHRVGLPRAGATLAWSVLQRETHLEGGAQPLCLELLWPRGLGRKKWARL